MSDEQAVASHYEHGDLLNAIKLSLKKLNKTQHDVSIDDLAAVDEFHIGGRIATQNLLSQFDIAQHHHLLDIGCGLGGAARYVAQKHHNRVSGIDLTDEFVATGNELCAWANLQHNIKLYHGSALSMPFENASFDGAYMMHVAMNIEDKAGLFKEIHRVLDSGAWLGVYDVMRVQAGDLLYPVPWAGEASTSHLASLENYKQVIESAGFEVLSQHNRQQFSLDFFKQLQEKNQANGGPPALGLHTLMQESTGIKIKNMIENISRGYIAPFELTARKI